MTCGKPQCKREWHRKKCAEWNKANSEYFKANYLQKKFNAAVQAPKAVRDPSKTRPKSRLNSGLPFGFVQEVIGVQQLIIIEYLAQLLFKRFQEVIKRQSCVNTG